MTVCNECKAEIPDGVKFCPDCGTPAESGPATPAVQESAPIESGPAWLTGSEPAANAEGEAPAAAEAAAAEAEEPFAAEASRPWVVENVGAAADEPLAAEPVAVEEPEPVTPPAATAYEPVSAEEPAQTGPPPAPPPAPSLVFSTPAPYYSEKASQPAQTAQPSQPAQFAEPAPQTVTTAPQYEAAQTAAPQTAVKPGERSTQQDLWPVEEPVPQPPPYNAPIVPDSKSADPRPPKGSVFAPVGIFTYLGLLILYNIPLIGWIFCIVLAITARNRNIRNYSIALIILAVIGIGLTILGFIFLSMNDIVQTVIDAVTNFIEAIT